MFGLLFSLFFFTSAYNVCAQATRGYWQQRVEYDIKVRLDDQKHLLTGEEEIVYYNRSPHTLRRVFFHLYYNAFQPGSMMHMRSKAVPDPDGRLHRIGRLKPEDQGYQKIISITQQGEPLRTSVEDTILTVWLHRPLRSGKKTTFALRFETQIPVMIRRSGRHNSEGIDYSMAQWYPKIAEYDAMGWHADPYVGREFYGVWGDFSVKLTLPSAYMVAATGVLQNADEIGKGYAKKKRKQPNKDELTWHFLAQDVHDFAWAADPDYVHEVVALPQGVSVRFFYKLPKGERRKVRQRNFQRLQGDLLDFFPIMEEKFGKYPYSTYSVIQGGDGGMEYPMATLISAYREYKSLLKVTVHEMMHSWYQGVLGSNESIYAWLDEGFTTYATRIVLHTLAPPEPPVVNPLQSIYKTYMKAVSAGKDERMNTWADHFVSNKGYVVSSYRKGAIFQHQLGYVVGQEALSRSLLRYYQTWQFKHPAPMDYIRVVEEESGLELDWYYEYFANTTHTIDYAVDALQGSNGHTEILLRREGVMPMPVDVYIRYRNGTEEAYTIPLAIMNGHKQVPNMRPLPAWHWTDPTYAFMLPVSLEDIKSVEIDPTKRLADIDDSNQRYPRGAVPSE